MHACIVGIQILNIKSPQIPHTHNTELEVVSIGWCQAIDSSEDVSEWVFK